MEMMTRAGIICVLVAFFGVQNVPAATDALEKGTYDIGVLKPIDSDLKVRVGEQAPDFSLKSISGKSVSLSDYKDVSNVVIAFIPSSWTTLSAQQMPSYNASQEIFRRNNTVLLGISVDNIPALYSWTMMMDGVWFPVLSDFWPHGAVAKKYGVLRSDGITERALFIVDKKGRIRYIGLQDINKDPSFEEITKQLEKIR